MSAPLAPILARFAGRCGECGEAIHRGDLIVRVGAAWLHEICATGAAAVEDDDQGAES